ncbi:hypothetical protein [Leptolyngbya sp. FACHB-17]|uniref:hypothetical protein n=1 Tax=unclassified Leptolyngbya TaxID=2650499 RepID=UPI00168034D8|nr:hypothetical protein [Leptolyngbya sp. FACHB-17]MBD2081526.1 hypothetical protein [Leptolyngbya sp. FACHB-17]
MPDTYSTEELLQILSRERQACINGQRLNLAAMPSGINPLLDRFVNSDGIQRFTAYRDFRSAIHQYQIEHQVSGIVWTALTIEGKTCRCLRIHEQLISLPSDLAILKAEKAKVIEFWRSVTVGFDSYLSLNSGKLHQRVTQEDIERIDARSEWAVLSQQGKAETLELILQLGWGKPEEAVYRRGFPESGSESIHAVRPGRVPIG